MGTTYAFTRELNIISNSKSIYTFSLVSYDAETKAKISEYGPFADIAEANAFCDANEIPFRIPFEILLAENERPALTATTQIAINVSPIE